MTDPELQELAELWQEPDAAEAENFQALARRARRRGRFLAYADWALAVALVGGSLFAILAAPGRLTTFAAIGLLIATIWLTWQRRRLRQMARTLDTTDRQGFIESSVRSARANLRRVTLTILALPPLVILALLMTMAARRGGHVSDPGQVLLDWAQSPRGMISLAIFALLIGLSLRSIARIRKELRSLKALRRAYEEENQAAGPEPD
jgi:L-cystine uptake protein TcyP (sodium:dicarboxylate symporter family)